MKLEILSDDKNWYIKTSEDNLIHLNPILDEDIIEVNFLDDDKKYVSVLYSNWDSMELRAIIDLKGNIVYSGINSIEQYIPEYDLFIIELNSEYINAETEAYFGLQTDTIYYTVIDSNGKLLIDFSKNYVSFEDGLFYVDNKEYTLQELSENL